MKKGPAVGAVAGSVARVRLRPLTRKVVAPLMVTGPAALLVNSRAAGPLGWVVAVSGLLSPSAFASKNWRLAVAPVRVKAAGALAAVTGLQPVPRSFCTVAVRMWCWVTAL